MPIDIFTRNVFECQSSPSRLHHRLLKMETLLEVVNQVAQFFFDFIPYNRVQLAYLEQLQACHKGFLVVLMENFKIFFICRFNHSCGIFSVHLIEKEMTFSFIFPVYKWPLVYMTSTYFLFILLYHDTSIQIVKISFMNTRSKTLLLFPCLF